MRKNLRNRQTIFGHRATRRITWLGGTEYKDANGVKTYMCFVFCFVSADGLSLARVVGQIGIDKNDRIVLPNFEMLNSQEHRVTIYCIAAELGQFEEAGEKLVGQLNERMRKIAEWKPPKTF